MNPRIVRAWPARRGEVRPGANIRLRASEKVRNVTRKTVILRRAGGARQPVAVSYRPKTRTIVVNPKRRLKRDAGYVVVVRSGVRDTSGNRMHRKTWRFRTIDNVKPRVVKVRPTRSGGVRPGANIRLWTSERVRHVNRRTVVLREVGGPRKAVAVANRPGRQMIVVNPKRRLKRDTRYVVVVRSSVRDTSGNRIHRKVWRFRTR